MNWKIRSAAVQDGSVPVQVEVVMDIYANPGDTDPVKTETFICPWDSVPEDVDGMCQALVTAYQQEQKNATQKQQQADTAVPLAQSLVGRKSK